MSHLARSNQVQSLPLQANVTAHIGTFKKTKLWVPGMVGGREAEKLSRGWLFTGVQAGGALILDKEAAKGR